MKLCELKRYFPLGGVVAIALLVYSCDLGVDNPEDIEDEDLNSPQGIEVLLNGVHGDFAFSTTQPGGGGIYTSAALLSDELVHSGTWMPLRMLSDGVSINTEPENQSRWASAQTARWSAEDLIERIEDVDEVDNDGAEMAEANLFSGLSNRMMGDNFCAAVIDGGEEEHYTVFHERSVEFFTTAIDLADQNDEQDIMLAAYAGRAQSHMMLGNWDEAAADAAEVGTGFTFEQVHSSNASREYNGVHEWTATPNEANQTTVWGTPFEEWGTEINDQSEDAEGDPRIPFEKIFVDGDPDADFDTGGDDERPLFYAHKHDDRGANIPIVKGTEMRLIEAEAYLRDGEVEDAIEKINTVREYHEDLETLDAGDFDEESAWEKLMKERGIEMWLEGRRVADLRRWMEDDQDVPFEVIRESDDAPVSVLDVEELCLEVSSTEEASNPNL